MRVRHSLLPVAFAASVTLCFPGIAHAQDNAAAVEALFSAGKKLMTDGKIGEACPKFLASYNLEHRIGTLLNLADCYEKDSQLASAWARFIQARTLAQRANQPEREAFASDHARTLESQLSTLALMVPSPAPGLTIRRDGVAVEAGAFGAAVAIDGGTHEISATAPGRIAWTSHVAIQGRGDHQTLQVPTLAIAPVAVAAAETEAHSNSRERSHTREYVGLGTASVGVVAIGIGAVFGVLAITKKNDTYASGGGCNIGGVADNCNSAGVSAHQTAVTDGTVSTVLIGVGAAAVVGGGVLWLTGRSAGATTVGFDGHNVLVSGRF